MVYLELLDLGLNQPFFADFFRSGWEFFLKNRVNYYFGL